MHSTALTLCKYFIALADAVLHPVLLKTVLSVQMQLHI